MSISGGMSRPAVSLIKCLLLENKQINHPGGAGAGLSWTRQECDNEGISDIRNDILTLTASWKAELTSASGKQQVAVII